LLKVVCSGPGVSRTRNLGLLIFKERLTHIHNARDEYGWCSGQWLKWKIRDEGQLWAPRQVVVGPKRFYEIRGVGTLDHNN